MFGKLQVLESKLDIYEDLSKEMLDKLERAVATISDNSNRVAIILERHENRLDEGEKTNEAIMKLIEKVEEKVWRMPLHKNYDKLMNSKNADVQNINYVGGAGSTTAAQFLQRFILNKTPWAHLDIAGMAFSKYGGALNSGGATGFGVRLLNQLVEENYE